MPLHDQRTIINEAGSFEAQRLGPVSRDAKRVLEEDSSKTQTFRSQNFVHDLHNLPARLNTCRSSA